jgi:protocatechuate 3,4-dioxygenase beta subunit
MIAGAGLLPLVSMPAAASSLVDACKEIAEETAGPFPSDGSNGPNVLDDTGIVRRNIRRSFGDASGRAEGVRLRMDLTLLNTAKGCAPYAGAAIYVWQCDAIGRYSMYSGGAEDQNYLRGVQAADAKGRLTFISTFPGMYPGRWPHVHFEIYENLEEATTYRNKIATSQLAFPRKACKKVYASEGYGNSAAYLASMNIEDDSVFSDGWKDQMASTTGSVSRGYTATLSIGV